MIKDLKQFVPSSVCLKCEGCCRFQAADSPWRPKWDKREFVDDKDHVTTIRDCGDHFCRFFNKGEGTCRTYHDRPFECELYPFLLSRHVDGIKVYVHLACPYVQDHQGGTEVGEYVEYLKEFFQQPSTLDFLKRNDRLIHDYAPFEAEIQYLFTIADRPSALLSHKGIFDQYLSRSSRPLSVYHFSAIFAWQDFFEFRFEIIDERLCVFAYQHGEPFLYLPPLGGAVSAATVDKCFEFMKGSRLARIENICDNQLPAFERGGYNADLKAHEYVHARKDLVELAGSAYKSKRHDIHVFEARYPGAIFRPYVPEDLEACKALYGRWSQERKAHNDDPLYAGMLEDNARVHPLLIANAAVLGLIGRVVIVNGDIAGYTFGYPLDERTFCVLLEVTDLGLTGLAAYLFNRFCADVELGRYDLINTMDDCGIPNVAAAKQSWLPVQVLPVYNLKRTA